MRPSLLACTLLLSLGCARSVEPMGRARDAGPPVEPPGAAAECRSDADCSITLVPEGGCCPRLCLGRAVPATESLKLDERQRACEERGGPCPDPVCARPRHRPVAVCTGGRCATRMMPMEER